MNSSAVEEEGILPILNQVKAFQSKWIAKNKQCETLDSFLTTANTENKQLRTTNEELKSALNAANIRTTEVENTCKVLKSSLNVSCVENEKLAAECDALKKSLDLTNVGMRELRVTYEKSESNLNAVNAKYCELQKKCETSESALIVSNTKNRDLETKCRDMELKYATLESSLHAADTKIKDLEVKLDECKKEIVRTKLEKKKIIISTLKKFQNKLLTNPLYAIIDRMKHNIDALDEAAKNTSQNLRQNDKEIEVVDIASSDDDDDASTLSVTSELRNMEEDFYFDVNMSPDSDDKRFINASRIDENVQLAVQISDTEENNEQNSAELITCDSDVQRALIDDASCDSNISLSVCTDDDVTSTTAEEEHLHSSEISSALIAEEHSYSDKSLISLEKTLPEATSMECTSTIVNDQTGATNESAIENLVPENNPVISLENRDERNFDRNEASPASSPAINDTAPEIGPVQIPESVRSNSPDVIDSKNTPVSTNQNEIISNYNDQYIETIVANLIKKYGRNLTLLHPVVLLTPVDEYKRVEVENSVEKCDSYPSLSNEKLPSSSV